MNTNNNSMSQMKPWKWVFLLFLIVASAIILSENKQKYRQVHNTIFSTVYNITYNSNKDLTQGIHSTMLSVDSTLSMFNKSSLLWNINNGLDNSTNQMFLTIFNMSKAVWDATGGAFDPTVAPLVNAWGFGYKSGDMPTDNQIDSIMQFVGFDRIELDPYNNVVKSDPRIMLDFSAIAKGYAVDAVAEYLKENGVTDYMVEIGGEIAVHGVNRQGNKWRIGVSIPQPDSDGLQEILSVTDIAMATSGNYRNYFEKDGVLYGHTINPATGHPAMNTLLSATVLAPTCAMADATATSFMVMGCDKALEYCSEHPGIEALLIYSKQDSTMDTLCTAGFRKLALE